MLFYKEDEDNKTNNFKKIGRTRERHFPNTNKRIGAAQKRDSDLAVGILHSLCFYSILWYRWFVLMSCLTFLCSVHNGPTQRKLSTDHYHGVAILSPLSEKNTDPDSTHRITTCVVPAFIYHLV